MTVANMPAEEVEITVDLVRALLREQHQDLAELHLELLANGWDNAIFRLGDDFTVRLPRRQMAAELVRHEQQWLPVLAPRLPLPIPVPVRIGVPKETYPWSWSVIPWLRGANAAQAPPADPDVTAGQLAEFLAALHQPAPDDAPVNSVRGGPLASRDEIVRQRLGQLAGLVDAAAVLPVWEESLRVPVHAGPPPWLHGDLHPANILVDDGRISAVIDFGDITGGDPACDLSVVWMLLPAKVRASVREHGYAIDDALWARSRGWALSLALAYLANSADNPMMRKVGEDTLQAVLVPD